MKTKVLLILVGLTAIGALIYGYLQSRQEGMREAEGEQPVTAENRIRRGPHGEPVVSLDLATQKLIGLNTAPLPGATLPPEIKTYGRVLDAAPLVALQSEIAAAGVALEASGNEYRRVKTLFDQGENASVRSVQTAEAAMKRDQIALAAAEAQLVSGWGQAVADQPDVAAFVHSLTQRDSVLVRLDLPLGEALPASPTGARLLLSRTDAAVNARYLGPAPTTDPQVQGEGFLVVATNRPARFSAGQALAGFLELPGAPRPGVIVPNDAVVRAENRAWVYTASGETNFTRREIALDDPVAGGWFVTNGVAAGERVVATGAQTLLSEEQKNQIQVGD